MIELGTSSRRPRPFRSATRPPLHIFTQRLTFYQKCQIVRLVNPIQRRYPDLLPERLSVIAGTIVTSRNLVATLNKPFEAASWGLGCLGHQIAMQALRGLAVSGKYPWLQFISEQGMAFTLVVGGTPLRVQSESEQIRPVMPGERAAWKQLPQRLPGFEFETDTGVLRIEVAQRAGKPVETVTLGLFDEHTGTQLERWELLSRSSGSIADGSTSSAASDRQAPPTGHQQRPASTGTVTQLTGGKPADVDTSNVYSFRAQDEKDAKG